MLLYVTGVPDADAMAGAWGAVAKAGKHPRTGAAFEPVVTRFDLFLRAFSPSGIPPVEGAYMWGIALRRALRELVAGAYPITAKWMAPFDGVGPETAKPARAELPGMTDIVEGLQKGEDPAQAASDPRAWLVIAPAMAAQIELMFLPAFLRAEPFARVARYPGTGEVGGWLAGELAELAAGRGLARDGLVFETGEGKPRVGITYRDAEGREQADITMLEATCALDETYAWKCVLAPGQCYARLHSHTGSEELYVVVAGEGVLRVNERVIPVKAGDCFGKPRNYDTATQIVNTGSVPLVMYDFGTLNRSEVDLCRYPEHGELLARFAGHRWLIASDGLRSGAEFWSLYDRRYRRTSKT